MIDPYSSLHGPCLTTFWICHQHHWMSVTTILVSESGNWKIAGVVNSSIFTSILVSLIFSTLPIADPIAIALQPLIVVSEDTCAFYMYAITAGSTKERRKRRTVYLYLIINTCHTAKDPRICVKYFHLSLPPFPLTAQHNSGVAVWVPKKWGKRRGDLTRETEGSQSAIYGSQCPMP